MRLKRDIQSHMIPLDRATDQRLSALCRHFGVRRLDLFGSATGPSYDPGRSDLDFLVEFEESSPAQHYDRYFGLLEALRKLFGRPVDLVEPQTIRNAFVRRRIDESRTILYAA
jgi:uncharacterized protein